MLYCVVYILQGILTLTFQVNIKSCLLLKDFKEQKTLKKTRRTIAFEIAKLIITSEFRTWKLSMFSSRSRLY